jgi:hypothetical protein
VLNIRSTFLEADANSLPTIAVHLAEAKRLLLIHRARVSNRTARQRIETLAWACSRMIVAIGHLKVR